MPDYPINITPIFKKAYMVKITPLTCTYDGDSQYVQHMLFSENVRIWIASSEGAFDSEYKEIILDNKAEYDGYILLPSSHTSLINAKVCVLTVKKATNVAGEYGFGYANAVPNGTANITMNILHTATTTKEVSGKRVASIYGRTAESNISCPYNTFSSWPDTLGFKYSYKIFYYKGDGSTEQVFESSESGTNEYVVPDAYLTNPYGGQIGAHGKMKAAEIEISSNSKSRFNSK